MIFEAVRGRPRSSKQGPLTPLPGIDTQISALFTPPSTPIYNKYMYTCIYPHCSPHRPRLHGRGEMEEDRERRGREGGRESDS
jgi:hypothetical protein